MKLVKARKAYKCDNYPRHVIDKGDFYVALPYSPKTDYAPRKGSGIAHICLSCALKWGVVVFEKGTALES